MFRVRFSKPALKALTKMPRNTGLLIREKIDQVAQDPGAPNNNLKPLKGRPGYRLRVGDWWVIYTLEEEIKVLSVEHIGPRRGVYE